MPAFFVAVKEENNARMIKGLCAALGFEETEPNAKIAGKIILWRAVKEQERREKALADQPEAAEGF